MRYGKGRKRSPLSPKAETFQKRRLLNQSSIESGSYQNKVTTNMRRKNLIYLTLVMIILPFFVLILNSCKDDSIIQETGETIKRDKKETEKEVTVENGYLVFSSQTVLEEYMNKVQKALEESNDKEILKNRAIMPHISGFVSLADKLGRLKNSQLKSGTNNYNVQKDFEYELTSQIIPDEVIHYVVDTANQVKIAGRIYQISPFGTFIYNEEDSVEYIKLCESFIDIFNNYTEQKDSITYIYGNITFIDSFGRMINSDNTPIEEQILSEFDGNTETTENNINNLKSTSTRIIPEYTKTYNLSTYKAGAKTIAGKAIQHIFGKNSWRKKRLDSKHRIKVKLYSVNYGFFRNQGFRVEYNTKKDRTITVFYFKHWRLRKKKIKLWSYWSSSKSIKEMVVGIDFFKGYTEYTTYGIGEAFQKNMQKQFSKNIGKYTINMCYNGLLKTPTQKVRGWATNLYIFSGSVGIWNHGFTDNELLEKGFDAGIDALRGMLKRKTSGLIYDIIGNTTNKPVAILTPNYKNGGNKEYLLLSGIYKYYNRSKTHVKLGHSSGGINLCLNPDGKIRSFSGFTPNKFRIDEAYIFGAVKYNNKWSGIRMYIN
jgi:hypothetical protein